MVSHQPIHSVEAASFFISREGNDDIPVRLKTLLLHANEVGYQESISGLDVVGAAAVKITIQFGEFKGIESPVLASCLNYVQVREQQNGLAHAGPAQARDQVSLARIRAQHLHVCGGEPDRLEPRRHCLGGRRGAADGIRRVDFNQFFENIASQLLLGRTDGGLLALRPAAAGKHSSRACEGEAKGSQQSSGRVHMLLSPLRLPRKSPCGLAANLIMTSRRLYRLLTKRGFPVRC